jgi:hypothetical protein
MLYVALLCYNSGAIPVAGVQRIFTYEKRVGVEGFTYRVKVYIVLKYTIRRKLTVSLTAFILLNIGDAATRVNACNTQPTCGALRAGSAWRAVSKLYLKVSLDRKRIYSFAVSKVLQQNRTFPKKSCRGYILV